MTRNNGFNVFSARNKAPQTTTVLPVRPDLFPDIKTEPARTPGENAFRIKRNNLQINACAQLKPVIMRPHVLMPCPERHVEVETLTDMRHPFGKRWGDYGKMVKLEHLQNGPFLEERHNGKESLTIGQERRSGKPRPLFHQRFGLSLFGSYAARLAQSSRKKITGSS